MRGFSEFAAPRRAGDRSAFEGFVNEKHFITKKMWNKIPAVFLRWFFRYNDWIKQNHANLPPGSENVYYVQLYVVGTNLVDMTPMRGIVVTYVWTVRENGEIKIEFHGKLPQD